MSYKGFTFLFLVLLGSGSLVAQNGLHYTFFDKTPLTLNPGMAGNFDGSIRVGAIWRAQDFRSQSVQYLSPAIFVDAHLIRGFRKYDWIGFGARFQYDKQSIISYDLTQNTFNGGLSYHFSFDKNRKNLLSFGVQTETVKAYFSSGFFIEGSDIDSIIDNNYDPDIIDLTHNLPLDINKKSNNTGFTIGLVYTSNISENNILNVGFSLGNIGKNLNYSLVDDTAGSVRRNLKLVGFANYRTELENGLILEPRMVFSYMDPSYEGSLQTLAGFKLKKLENTTVYCGLGYNFINCVQFLLAADAKEIRAFCSFDLNIQKKTSVSGPARAFEIGLAYIFKINKKPSLETFDLSALKKYNILTNKGI